MRASPPDTRSRRRRRLRVNSRRCHSRLTCRCTRHGNSGCWSYSDTPRRRSRRPLPGRCPPRRPEAANPPVVPRNPPAPSPGRTMRAERGSLADRGRRALRRLPGRGFHSLNKRSVTPPFRSVALPLPWSRHDAPWLGHPIAKDAGLPLARPSGGPVGCLFRLLQHLLQRFRAAVAHRASERVDQLVGQVRHHLFRQLPRQCVRDRAGDR